MPLPPFSDFFPTTLVATDAIATEQVRLTVKCNAQFRAAHTRPGQFCKIKVGEEEGIFALLGAPGSEDADFLIKVTAADHDGAGRGGAARALANLGVGAPLELTLPTGAGFGLEAAKGRDLYFVATGTGVAPVAAALDWVLTHRSDYGALHLDHGLQSEAHLAIEPSLERWREAGVSVAVHYSFLNPEGEVQGRSVQEALAERAGDLSGGAIVAIGQGAMMKSLKKIALEAGCPPELFLSNF